MLKCSVGLRVTAESGDNYVWVHHYKRRYYKRNAVISCTSVKNLLTVTKMLLIALCGAHTKCMKHFLYAQNRRTSLNQATRTVQCKHVDVT